MPDVMAAWEEWSGLSDEQREYSLFKILQSMDGRLARLEECKKSELKDKGYAAGSGFVGGFVAALLRNFGASP